MRAAALLALAGCTFVHHHQRATAVTATTTIITGLAVLSPLTDCTRQPNDHCRLQMIEAGAGGLAASAVIGGITAAELSGADWTPPKLATTRAEAKPDTAAPDEPRIVPAASVAATSIERDGVAIDADRAGACVAAKASAFRFLDVGCGHVAATDVLDADCDCKPTSLGIACHVVASATCTGDVAARVELGSGAGTRAGAEAAAQVDASSSCAPEAASDATPTCDCDKSGLCECAVVERCAPAQPSE